MGTHDLPSMFAHSFWAYKSGKSQVPMLQLLSNISGQYERNHWILLYACLKDSTMARYTGIYISLWRGMPKCTLPPGLFKVCFYDIYY